MGSASQFCLPYSLISPVGLRTPCDTEWTVHLTDFRKIITNKSIIQLRVRTYLLGCDKHLVEKTQPLKNKHRALGLWDLLQGLFIQCQAVAQFHHHGGRSATQTCHNKSEVGHHYTNNRAVFCKECRDCRTGEEGKPLDT